MRISHQTRQVLTALIDAPAQEVFGFQLTEATALPTGTVYPILKRLEAEKWLTSRWEELDERGSARRRRRYYRLTGLGERQAREAITGQEEGLRMLMPGWAR